MARSSPRGFALARLCALGLVLAAPAACRASEEVPRPAPADAAPDQVRTAGGGSAPVAAGQALVIFGNDTVVAEVASTPAQRERGLERTQHPPPANDAYDQAAGEREQPEHERSRPGIGGDGGDAAPVDPTEGQPQEGRRDRQSRGGPERAMHGGHAIDSSTRVAGS